MKPPKLNYLKILKFILNLGENWINLKQFIQCKNLSKYHFFDDLEN